MLNLLFYNSLNLISQNTPPIWFMRQAGRYHNHYQKLKEKYSFIELCKNPELSSEVACGPVKEFDFDLAILFSDILYPLEGLGLSLEYNPGPIFNEYISKENFQKFTNIELALEHLKFQSECIKLTKEKLPASKSIIGFVGGLWTLLRYAIGRTNSIHKIESFHLDFMENILLPLIKNNIKLQLDAGAEIVMIFDSGLEDLEEEVFQKQYFLYLQDISNSFNGKLGYYCRGKNIENIALLFNLPFAGLGVDKNITILPSTG